MPAITKDEAIKKLRDAMQKISTPAAPVVAEGLMNQAIELLGEVIGPKAGNWWTLEKRVEEFMRQVAAHPVAGSPADPMDWPLPCDVKVGHGTIGKGCKLRTLVARMDVLYNMAHEKAEPMPASEAARQTLPQEHVMPPTRGTDSQPDANLAALRLTQELNRISMSLAADLVQSADYTFGGTDYLDRNQVMNRIMDWRSEWDATAEARRELTARCRAEGGVTNKQVERCKLRLCCRDDAHATDCNTYDPARNCDEFAAPAAPTDAKGE